MSAEHTQHTDVSWAVMIELLHRIQTETGHQYTATSLKRNSSAQFGDVYH